MHEQNLSVPDATFIKDEVVPVIEETAQITIRPAASGFVRVRTKTESVDRIAQADVKHDDVEVTRINIDKVVDKAPLVRIEGDLTIIPVLEEVLFVETRLVLKEEIHIRRRTSTQTVSTPITLRQQHAVVERDGTRGASNSD